MQIDKSRFPLVFLRETALSRTENPEAELEAIFADGLPFVLISDHPPHDEKNEPPEAKKARALFFKCNKALFQRYCAGAIVIEGAKATPTPLRLAAQAFGKGFGVPFHFVLDEEAAMELGNRLLMNLDAGSAGS
ncbi:hypothetical protein [Methylorubrum extorquens]|jgi:hypothetical protein|uniref:Uncharacterized protein n=1 Tax=Methylorubrum extorquens DSM 13060 TaxID=882800 RepID=H1KGD1_METEX|nr:hypothetical protein [Methylorubrum extorquens]EHP93389.1 hypothetical protein MetexDRAFT_1693 [Methylorubrum extorquens DSM 13060]